MTRTDALHMVTAPLQGEARTNARQAMKVGGLLGWNVIKAESYAKLIGTPHGLPFMPDMLRDDDYKLVGRVDGQPRILARSVSESYHVFQNEEVADLMDAVLYETGGEFEVAQKFRGGRLVYLTIKLPDTVYVDGQDPVDMYLNGINSFDGSTNLMLSVDPVRAWCSNQLNYFRKGSFKIRHSSGMKGKVVQAREALKITLKATEGFREHAQRLHNTPLHEETFEEIMERVFPRPREYGQLTVDAEEAKRVERITERYRLQRKQLRETLHSEANEPISGSAWGGLNAVIEYLDHVRMPGQAVARRAERIMLSDADIKRKMHAAREFQALAA